MSNASVVALRSPRRVALAFAVLFALGAALVGGATAEARRGRGKAPSVGSSACKTDADCVVVIDDCCSCSEGGKQRAIPKKERAAYDKDRKKRCQGTMCTEVMSPDPTCSQRAMCAAGICELIDAETPAL